MSSLGEITVRFMYDYMQFNYYMDNNCAMSFIRSSQITELQQKIIDAEQGIFYACNQS